MQYQVFTCLDLGSILTLELVKFIEEVIFVKDATYPEAESIFYDEFIFKYHFVFI